MIHRFKVVCLDLKGQRSRQLVLNQLDATRLGLFVDDLVDLKTSTGHHRLPVVITETVVQPGSIGIYRNLARQGVCKAKETVSLKVIGKPASVEVIKRKLLGESLSEEDYDLLISDITNDQLTDVELTYFVAAGFMRSYSLSELYFLTKSMAKHGSQLKWRAPILDKHSIGGLAGNRTSMITIPLVASLGFKIPKTSSRAITSPAGTSDVMEVLAPVIFPVKDIRKIVNKTNSCLVWGGGLDLAPADDKIIRVSYPLSAEPYSKMIVSIMAKKVAAGVNYLVIDIPYGKEVKVKDLKTAKKIATTFIQLGRKFKIKVRPLISRANQPIGSGVGPLLEARDVLRVLQQNKKRPLDLEKKAVLLATHLIALATSKSVREVKPLVVNNLKNGQAWLKMQEIIKAQGGQPNILADKLTLGTFSYQFKALTSGRVKQIHNQGINELCRLLGAPKHQMAGIYLHYKLKDWVNEGQVLVTLYTDQKEKLKLAIDYLSENNIYSI